MSNHTPYTPDQINDLFEKMTSKTSSQRDPALQRIMFLSPNLRFSLFSTNTKQDGWSVLAATGRAALSSHWSRETFERLLKGATQEVLDRKSSDGVPDGIWVWMGCMNAIKKNPGRKSRLLNSRKSLERVWGVINMSEAIDDFAGVVQIFKPSIQRAFIAALSEELSYQWSHRFDVFVARWVKLQAVFQNHSPPAPPPRFLSSGSLGDFWISSKTNVDFCIEHAGMLKECLLLPIEEPIKTTLEVLENAVPIVPASLMRAWSANDHMTAYLLNLHSLRQKEALTNVLEPRAHSSSRNRL